jgi:hypothetical protein
MKLLRTFPKVSFEFGLASWQWLGLREQTPRFATCFGDIFLESLDGWWFLDTVEGTLELRWTSAVTMYAELESAEGRATYLMDDLVRDARSRGIHLDEDDVYAFNPHPALGGELGVNGLSAMRFELAVNWVGQMHDQVLHGAGEINLPPMPDDGRRNTARQVTAAWDAAWSDDETFDMPFEQYLATTTFAAVAAPKQHNDAESPSLPSLPSSEPRHRSHAAHILDAPRYDTQHYATPAERVPPTPAPPAPAEQSATPPGPTPPWPGQEQTAPPWSGQTEMAQPWSAPDQTAPLGTPPEGYDVSYDPAYPSTGVADEQPGAPYAQQDWLTDDAAPGGDGHDEHNQAGQAWGSPTWGNPNWGNPAVSGPTWGNPSWGGQPPAVAAGGGTHQAPRTDDPFTAWDDLWGKR